MGSAIAGRIKGKYRVFGFDKDEEKIKNLENKMVIDSAVNLVKNSDVIILAIKPQDFEPLLSEIKGEVSDKLIISIAAGISTKKIEDVLGKIKVVRVMPNIGAIVGEAVSFICRGSFAESKDLNLAIKLFKLIGYVFVIPEDLMHLATAIGGSGPGFWGYLYDKKPRKEWDEYASKHFIPELASVAKDRGFDEKMANKTAQSVTFASISTANALDITPMELAIKVASKGGTTEAGLEVLKKGGSLADAVQAALRRAEELSKG